MTEHEILGHFSVNIYHVIFFSPKKVITLKVSKRRRATIHQIFIWECLQKTVRLFAFSEGESTWNLRMRECRRMECSIQIDKAFCGCLVSCGFILSNSCRVLYVLSFQSILQPNVFCYAYCESCLVFFPLNTSKVIVCINQVLLRWSLTICDLWHGCNVFYPFILHPNSKLKSWIKLNTVVSTIHVAWSRMDMSLFS